MFLFRCRHCVQLKGKFLCNWLNGLEFCYLNMSIVFKFTTKQLERLSKKAEKEQKVQENKVKKVRYFLIQNVKLIKDFSPTLGWLLFFIENLISKSAIFWTCSGRFAYVNLLNKSIISRISTCSRNVICLVGWLIKVVIWWPLKLITYFKTIYFYTNLSFWLQGDKREEHWNGPSLCRECHKKEERGTKLPEDGSQGGCRFCPSPKCPDHEGRGLIKTTQFIYLVVNLCALTTIGSEY